MNTDHDRLRGFPQGRSFIPGGLGFPLGIDPSSVPAKKPPSTDYGAWYDASVTSSLAIESAAVAQWNDLSGNGYHLASVGGSTTRPAYAAGREIRRVVCPDFDGSNDAFSSVYSYFPGSTLAYTFIAVIAPDNVTALQALVASQASNGPQTVIETSSKLEHLREATANLATLDGKLLTVGQPAVVADSFAQIASADDIAQLVIDRTYQRVAINDIGTNSGDGLMRIGARSNLTNFYDGLIAEIVMWTRAMDREELMANVNYLQAKWCVD